MIFIHARSLTADDMTHIGNNVLEAVRRERRRSHDHDPIGDTPSPADELADDTDGLANLVLFAPPPRPAA